MFPDGSVFKGISLSGCFRWPVHNEPASTLKKGREGPSTVGVGHSHAPGVGSGPGRSPSPSRPSGLVPWPGPSCFSSRGVPSFPLVCLTTFATSWGSNQDGGGPPLLPVSEHPEWRPCRQMWTPAHSPSWRPRVLCLRAEGSPGPPETELKDAGRREAPRLVGLAACSGGSAGGAGRNRMSASSRAAAVKRAPCLFGCSGRCLTN